MRRSPFLAVALVIAWPLAASAQTGSLFNRGGQTGSSLSGTSQRSGGGLTGSTFSGGSSSGSGSSSGGSSLFNNGSSSLTGGGLTGQNSLTGGGLTGQGSNTSGSQQGFQFGQLSETVGTGPFIGRSDNAGRFVGNSFAGQQSALGAMQALQGLQGLQRSGGGFNNRSNQQQAERLPMRPTQRISFDYTPATPATATRRVAARFDGIVARRPELNGVSFASDDAGRVVLRGTVANREAGELAAALVRLEPGVRDVVNELTVGPGAGR
jgi:BON domain